MHLAKLNETLNIWITALQDYDFNTLVTKPDPETWSLGQVFLHLISETNYYIGQIEYCLTHHENSSEQMAENGLLMFANNEFPDERIKNDAPSAQNIPQPMNKSDLLEQMFRNVAIISSSFRREDFFSGQGARRERSLSYATDEATKSGEKSRRPNREVIIATFLSLKTQLNLLWDKILISNLWVKPGTPD
ncbi:MAG: hypothetical protein ACKV1O_26640 [Saprospiraceae bacterium]